MRRNRDEIELRLTPAATVVSPARARRRGRVAGTRRRTTVAGAARRRRTSVRRRRGSGGFDASSVNGHFVICSLCSHREIIISDYAAASCAIKPCKEGKPLAGPVPPWIIDYRRLDSIYLTAPEASHCPPPAPAPSGKRLRFLIHSVALKKISLKMYVRAPGLNTLNTTGPWLVRAIRVFIIIWNYLSIKWEREREIPFFYLRGEGKRPMFEYNNTHCVNDFHNFHLVY